MDKCEPSRFDRQILCDQNESAPKSSTVITLIYASLPACQPFRSSVGAEAHLAARLHMTPAAVRAAHAVAVAEGIATVRRDQEKEREEEREECRALPLQVETLERKTEGFIIAAFAGR